jgi:hypothetical protein
MPAPQTLSVLLVDDNAAFLEQLRSALVQELNDPTVEVRTWQPSNEDQDASTKFDSLLDDGTVLVATDYDLTTGMRGLFGLTIVAWCQQKSIPVGDFSRDNANQLPKEPNLFEFRIPPTEIEGAQFIAAAFRGFREIRRRLEATETLLTKRSLASVLATLLGRASLESQFALYMNRIGASNSSLVQKIKDFTGGVQPSPGEKRKLLVYVLGHVLFNSILKFPGPILSDKVLAAYAATSAAEAEALATLFESARYNGPFAENHRYYWRDDIEKKIDELGAALNAEQFEDTADFNRKVIETALNRPLSNHDCERCGGTRGGFWCPFMVRPVCLRSDCSVAASSWIPQGAQLCRVERQFYDEWAPLLGL